MILRSLSSRSVLVLAIACACLVDRGGLFAQSGEAVAPPTEFDTYFMVLLKRGPKADEISESDLQTIQQGHLAHLMGLMASGKIAVAGPFETQPDDELRGVVLFPGHMTREEVAALANEDPAVKAGRLAVEILKWWVPKGVLSWKPYEADR